MISWLSESGQLWGSEVSCLLSCIIVHCLFQPVSYKAADCTLSFTCAIKITNKSLSSLFSGYGTLQYAVCAPHGGLWHILHGSTNSAAYLRCLLEVSSTRLHCRTTTKHNTDLQNYSFECSFQLLQSSVANMVLVSYVSFSSFTARYSRRHTYTLKDSRLKFPTWACLGWNSSWRGVDPLWARTAISNNWEQTRDGGRCVWQDGIMWRVLVKASMATNSSVADGSGLSNDWLTQFQEMISTSLVKYMTTWILTFLTMVNEIKLVFNRGGLNTLLINCQANKRSLNFFAET